MGSTTHTKQTLPLGETVVPPPFTPENLAPDREAAPDGDSNASNTSTQIDLEAAPEVPPPPIVSDWEKRVAELKAQGMVIPVDPLPEGKQMRWLPEYYGRDRKQIDPTNDPAQISVIIWVNQGVKFVVGFGQHPGGFDSCNIAQVDGGGVVMGLWTLDEEGRICICCNCMNRPNFGEDNLNSAVPRGFLTKAGKPEEGARDELREEVGEMAFPLKLTLLGTSNPDSAFFFGERTAGHGVKFYGCQIDGGAVARDDQGVLRIRKDLLRPDNASRTLEQIFDSGFFVRLDLLMGNYDGFTNGLITFLLAYLCRTPEGLQLVINTLQGLVTSE